MAIRFVGGPAASVLRGMGTLVVGTGLARVIGIVSIPILTRIYSPGDFGVLAVYVALVAILLPVTTLQYHVATPLPRRDGMAMNVLALSLVLMLSVSLLLTVLSGFFGEGLFALFEMEVLATYWWLVIAGLLGSGLYKLLTSWATRKKSYKQIARTLIYQSAAGSITKILLGAIAFGPIGLLIGQIVAQSGGVGSFLSRFWPDFHRLRASISRKRMLMAAAYFRGFPFFNLPSQVLGVAATKAPIFAFAILFDAEVTGQLAIAILVVGLPLGLLSRTVSRPYYAEVAALGRKNAQAIGRMSQALSKRLLVISILPAVAIYLLSPLVFPILLGQDWVVAGQLASWLALFLVTQFVSTPLVHVLPIFKRQDLLLTLNAQKFVLITAVFLLAWHVGLGPTQAVAAYSLVLATHFGFVTFMVLRTIRRAEVEVEP